VGDSETSDEVIKMLEAHRNDWGDPPGMHCDHGSGNLAENTLSYLQTHGIELTPAGPYNPKGNGTDDGAFSQMKHVRDEGKGFQRAARSGEAVSQGL